MESGETVSLMKRGVSTVQRHQVATSSMPAAAAAAAAGQGKDNGKRDDGDSGVIGGRFANAVAEAVGGAFGTIFFDVVEAVSGPSRIWQAPSA